MLWFCNKMGFRTKECLNDVQVSFPRMESEQLPLLCLWFGGALDSLVGGGFHFFGLHSIVDGISYFFPPFLVTFFRNHPLTCWELVGWDWKQAEHTHRMSRKRINEGTEAGFYCWRWLDRRWLPCSGPQELHVLPVAAAALVTVLFLDDWAQDVGRFVWVGSRCIERQRLSVIKKQCKQDKGVYYCGCHLLVRYEVYCVEERPLPLMPASPVKPFNFGPWATSWNVF